MQNSLELAMQTLKHMPAHATREVNQILTEINFKVHSFLKQSFAQSSTDTIWWYLQLRLA